MTFYKLWTHDFRSPLQGGKPVWDGSLPFELPEVDLDLGEKECSHGWNFTDDLAKGFQIAGMWPNGRPSLISTSKMDELLAKLAGDCGLTVKMLAANA